MCSLGYLETMEDEFVSAAKRFFTLLWEIGSVVHPDHLISLDPLHFGVYPVHMPFQPLATHLHSLYLTALSSSNVKRELLERANTQQRVSITVEVYGQDIYSQYKSTLGDKWQALNNSPGTAIPLQTGLYALYWLAFCCCMRNLLTTRDFEVFYWLVKSRDLWYGLSVCVISDVVSAYETAPKSVQALLLSTLHECCYDTNQDPTLYRAVSDQLRNTRNERFGDYFQISTVNFDPGMREILTQILGKNCIYEQYQSILRPACSLLPDDTFLELYTRAKEQFKRNICAMESLLTNWKAHGITLPSGDVLVDLQVGVAPELLHGYWLCICLHRVKNSKAMQRLLRTF